MVSRIRFPVAVFSLAAALALGSAQAQEATVSGKLTTTEDDALYGVAVLRSAPDHGSDVVTTLSPGAKVRVFPETSPSGWYYVELTTEEGSSHSGFVPQSFVRTSQGPFQDVDEEHWAAAALGRLKEGGFLGGYDDGFFRGEQAFTRFEMAVILDRYMSRLGEARDRIEKMISNIPMKPNLAGAEAKNLDQVVAQLQSVAKEEKDLHARIDRMQRTLTDHDARIVAAGNRIDENEKHDKDRDRRIDELAHTATRISGELAMLRSNETSGGGEGTKVSSSLASNIVRVKELVARTESLEAKVAALEARDRLASLLMKDGGKRSTAATDLAARVEMLTGKEAGL